jgi:ribosomal protein S18 acetylase RimI-like enzyme
MSIQQNQIVEAEAMPTVLVRPAEANDVEGIVRIDPSVQDDQARRALVDSAIGRGECWVAVDNQAVVGFGVMSHIFFDRGFVHLVYVDSAHRRRGAGTSLFDEFERQCRSTRIFTSANLSNLPMHAFLASRGYVLSGMVQDLDDGDPEMFFSKRIR